MLLQRKLSQIINKILKKSPHTRSISLNPKSNLSAILVAKIIESDDDDNIEQGNRTKITMTILRKARECQKGELDIVLFAIRTIKADDDDNIVQGNRM